MLDHIKQESSLQEEEYQDEIRELKRKLTENDTILKAAQLDAEAQQKLNEELSKFLIFCVKMFDFVLSFLVKSLSTKNSIERDLELKEQALQKAQLKIKELEYARESYLEFQQQAKVCKILKAYLRAVHIFIFLFLSKKDLLCAKLIH